jgi:hypothetical protein
VTWQPLSVRQGRREPDGPYEGVPSHLRKHLRDWFESVATGYQGYPDSQKLNGLALTFRVPLPSGHSPTELAAVVLDRADQDEHLFIDMIDYLLHESDMDLSLVDWLRETLDKGASVWTISADNRSLVRRVDPTTAEAFVLATTPEDASSAELREAWSAAYGLHPDASDAWDHSIKAVEAVLIPIVVPKQASPQLGHVLGQLGRQGDRWELVLATHQGPNAIEVLVGMLRLMWPNPDRHGAPDSRLPYLTEAQAVVHLGVTIVQWVRSGVLVRR